MAVCDDVRGGGGGDEAADPRAVCLYLEYTELCTIADGSIVDVDVSTEPTRLCTCSGDQIDGRTHERRKTLASAY